MIVGESPRKRYFLIREFDRIAPHTVFIDESNPIIPRCTETLQSGQIFPLRNGPRKPDRRDFVKDAYPSCARVEWGTPD